MNTLPGQPFFHYQNNELFIEDIPVATLAQQYGTPLYIYSRNALRQFVSAYQQALQGQPHQICYAIKANSTLAILQTFAQMGCGFDIVSGGELQRVLAAGAKASTILFSGVGKTRDEIRMALRAGIKCFNIESLSEIDTISQIAQETGLTAPVSLRVNPDVDAQTHPYISTGLKNNKFGIAYDQAFSAYQYAAKQPGLRIIGIDCHIGSQITQAQPFLDALDRLIALAQQIIASGISLHHLDLGGGLGITYQSETPPPHHALYHAVVEQLRAHNLGHLELLVEPGRSLVGNAGALITQVIHLKTGETKNFCIVDAAMNDLARPAMYEAYHAITEVMRPAGKSTPFICDVVGPICESSDWLGRDRQLHVRQHDYLAILSAGAYSMTMASNYNTRARAAEVLVDGENAYLIRERESIASLYANEHLIT